MCKFFSAECSVLRATTSRVAVRRLGCRDPGLFFLVLQSGDKGLRGNTLVERRREPATPRRRFPSILRGGPTWSEDPGLTDADGLTASISVFLLTFFGRNLVLFLV